MGRGIARCRPFGLEDSQMKASTMKSAARVAGPAPKVKQPATGPDAAELHALLLRWGKLNADLQELCEDTPAKFGAGHNTASVFQDVIDDVQRAIVGAYTAAAVVTV